MITPQTKMEAMQLEYSLGLEKRIAALETIMRDAHDALLMSEGILRKHAYEATADEVKRVYDKVCAAVPMTATQ